MKAVKVISIFILVSVILLGSIGVTSFEHVCSKNGVSVSYFIPTSHHCKDDKAVKQDKTKGCCENDLLFDKYKFNYKEQPCCSNAIDYIYFDSDRTNSDSQEVDMVFENNEFRIQSFKRFTARLKNTFYRGPPPFPLLATLAKLQTYII